jgi:nucleoside-diphosphate-sugar epimerase
MARDRRDWWVPRSCQYGPEHGLRQDWAGRPGLMRWIWSRSGYGTRSGLSMGVVHNARMRVFVAGATGALGRVLVPRLVAAGHEVTGLTRSPEKVAALTAAGATAVVADATDAARLRTAVLDAGPEAVIDELTDLPHEIKPFGVRRVYDRLTPLKRVASPALLAAAEEAGAGVHIAQSVAFLYPPASAGNGESGGVATEDEPVWLDGPAPWDVALPVFDTVERAVAGSTVLTGIVLRYGFFYGPGTHYDRDGSLTRLVRRRAYPLVGAGGGVSSFIHVDDAAAATVAALARPRSGIYNIVDDMPVPARTWLPVLADIIGAEPPRRVPIPLARLTAGSLVVHFATTLRGASNAKAKREFGWVPRFPAYDEGFRQTLS